jgi:hypothetical protein
MSSKKIDLFNIAMIFVSLLVAFNIPFQLFLFSYAFLGPLHYLTEINWLKKQNYFSTTASRKWITVFFVLTFLIICPQILNQFIIPHLNKGSDHVLMSISKFLGSIYTNLIFIAFFTAFGFAFLKNGLQILYLFIAAIILSYWVVKIKIGLILIGTFLPTLIHVYLFTLLFMLYGAIKNKSRYGYVSVLCMLLVIIIISMANINPDDYRVSDQVLANFFMSKMQLVIAASAQLLGSVQEGDKMSIYSTLMIKIQIFIAFAYTYHYLNWFSKTSIIKWHQISKTQSTTILTFWFLSIALYLYDYKTGLAVLLFLSFLHVILEFPLNYISIKGIFRK